MRFPKANDILTLRPGEKDIRELAMKIVSSNITMCNGEPIRFSMECEPLAEHLVMNVPRCLQRKKVIFHPPATVVLWEDGTKTVVKCDWRDQYDPMHGLALCYMKKALGNTSRNLNDALHKPEEDKGGK